MPHPRLGLPDLGFGVGLRNVHLADILAHGPRVDWFEIISENYIDHHGYSHDALLRLREYTPIVMHGVSLSIGSSDPLNMAYLHKLRALADEVRPAWISDHLCWTGALTVNSHDLLPLPLNEATFAHVRQRVLAVQDFLGRPLVLENVSSYVRAKADEGQRRRRQDRGADPHREIDDHVRQRAGQDGEHLFALHQRRRDRRRRGADHEGRQRAGLL